MSTTAQNMSRRDFLKSATAAAGVAALSTMIVFRANAAAGSGELLMSPATPNPQGAFERLFLLKGDPLAGPVRAIVTETGNPAPAPSLAPGERRVLRLMHFNDMHNHLTDQHSKKGDTHRLSQMVKLVRETRAGAGDSEAVFFVSVGDDHTGSVFDELVGWSPEDFVTDPAYRAYSAAGLDIAVLGNHEFDRGAELLRMGLKRDATFPVLSANVHGSAFLARDEDYVCAAIAEAKGLRVGFIGLTTAVDTRVGQPSDPSLAVASPVEAIRNVLPAVAEVCDVVVILSHCGFGSGSHRSGKAGAARMIGEGDLDIAAAAGPLTSKPIVLLGGHSHTMLNSGGIDTDNVVEGVLIAQAEANGKFLGDISMSIAAENGRKAWFSSVSLHPVKNRDDRVKADEPSYAALEHEGDYDAAFEAETIAPLLKALDSKLAEEIGQVASDELVSTERTLADRYIREVAIANFMNDALVQRSSTFPGGQIDIALFNATGLQTGISQGPLTFKAWYDVMPYADNVHVATMTGAQILEMLDNNAKRFVRPEELTAGTLDLTQFVSRGLLHFSSALRYRVDLGASAAQAKAVDVTIAGTPIGDVLDKTYKVAFNTYVSLGAFGEAWNGKPVSGGVPGDIPSMDLRKLDYDHTGLVYRNEIIAHIRDLKVISAETGARLDGRLAIG